MRTTTPARRPLDSISQSSKHASTHTIFLHEDSALDKPPYNREVLEGQIARLANNEEQAATRRDFHFACGRFRRSLVLPDPSAPHPFHSHWPNSYRRSPWTHQQRFLEPGKRHLSTQRPTRLIKGGLPLTVGRRLADGVLFSPSATRIGLGCRPGGSESVVGWISGSNSTRGANSTVSQLSGVRIDQQSSRNPQRSVDNLWTLFALIVSARYWTIENRSEKRKSLITFIHAVPRRWAGQDSNL